MFCIYWVGLCFLDCFVVVLFVIDYSYSYDDIGGNNDE